MKRVTIVESLVLKQAKHYGSGDLELVRFPKSSYKNLFPLKGGNALEVTETIEKEYHQILEWHTPGEEPIYIVYSDEVQKLLMRPFDDLMRQIEQLNCGQLLREGKIVCLKNRVKEFVNAGVWARLKYLFTGRIK